MKRILALLVATVLLLAGCGAEKAVQTTAPTEASTVPAETEPKQKSREEMHIFISLPEEEDSRWQRAGADLEMLLRNLFYQVTLRYAKSDAAEQARQLAEALEAGVDCILLAPVDPVTLTEVCATAEEMGVPLVSYDRMVTDTEHLDYYVSYDYRTIGVEMGNHIVEKAALDTAEKPLTVEFFMGAPEDNRALLLYLGILEVLQPYLEEGKLLANSGRTAFEDICTVDGTAGSVEEAFRSYLQDHYRRTRPDIICTASDAFADACIRVLEEKKLEIPLITGVGGTEAGLANVQGKKQSFTVTLALEPLDEACVSLIDAVLTGKEPELNDRESCHNNAKVVPAFLCSHTVHTPPEEVPEETVPATEPGA